MTRQTTMCAARSARELWRHLRTRAPARAVDGQVARAAARFATPERPRLPAPASTRGDRGVSLRPPRRRVAPGLARAGQLTGGPPAGAPAGRELGQ